MPSKYKVKDISFYLSCLNFKDYSEIEAFMVSLHTDETAQHLQKVAKYSHLLSELHGLDKEVCALIKNGSLFHDIGKIGIPKDILNKPGPLDDVEWEIMKKHSMMGKEILDASSCLSLRFASEIALTHHEYYNGEGYPHGLKGEEIAISSRIVSIVDTFDALSSTRCYKEAWSDEEIFRYLKGKRAVQFDPELIDLFFKNIEQFLEIRGEYY